VVAPTGRLRGLRAAPAQTLYPDSLKSRENVLAFVPSFLLAHFRRGNLEPQLSLGLKMGVINGIIAASARSR
jgi:hypothetical protein